MSKARRIVVRSDSSNIGTLAFLFTILPPSFRYGGDVECFAGDAMPVIFDAQQLYDRVRPFLRPTKKEEGQEESFPSPLEVPRITMTLQQPFAFYNLRLSHNEP